MGEPCVKEDKIARLEQDVISINDRLSRHSDKIDKISDNNLVLETILKRLEEDSISQKQTNSEMNKTMLSIQGAMTEITFNVRELNTKLASTEEKIDSTAKRVNEIDSKGKFDAITFIVKTAIPLLLGLGVGAYIMQFIK